MKLIRTRLLLPLLAALFLTVGLSACGGSPQSTPTDAADNVVGIYRLRQLIQQVALVDGVDLHPVKAASLGVVGTVSEGFHDAADLLHRQGTADFVQPAMRDGGGSHRRELP